jgi:hypothetical protein
VADERTTGPGSAIPPRTRHAPPKPAEPAPSKTLGERAKSAAKTLSARAKTAKELIHLACIPLAGKAAIDAKRNGPKYVEQYGENAVYVSPFALDVYAIQTHSDALAESVAELGDIYKPLGVILDRIASVVPGASIGGVIIMLGMQIAENHGKLNPQTRDMSPFPILTRDELFKDMMDEAAKANENGATVSAA